MAGETLDIDEYLAAADALLKEQAGTLQQLSSQLKKKGHESLAGECMEKSAELAAAVEAPETPADRMTQLCSAQATKLVQLSAAAIQEEKMDLAAKCLEAASGLGSTMASYEMGRLWEHGIGRDRDLAQAAKYYKLAADQQHPGAMTCLARMHLAGSGIVRDIETARTLFSAASALGNTDAACGLALLQLFHTQIDKEETFWTALEMLDVCCEIGNEEALWTMAALYRAGHSMKLTTGETVTLESKPERAFKCYKRLAEQGHAQAMFSVGGYYEKGWGTDQDIELAFEWYQKAADKGNTDGMFMCATLLEKGVQDSSKGPPTLLSKWLVLPDLEAAVAYYSMAARAGDEEALARMKQLEQELCES